MLHAAFLDKNANRKYPLKAIVSAENSTSFTIPDPWFLGMRLNVPIGYHKVYIERIFLDNGFISVMLACKLVPTEATVILGSFSTALDIDYKNVYFSSLGYGVSGLLILGKVSDFSGYSGNYDFGAATYALTTAQIEESLITVIPLPGLKSISCRGNKVTGNVTLALENIKKVTATNANDIHLNVINKTSLYSRLDKSFSFGNCNSPVIGSINSVEPDENGNIDIFGIKPVVITLLSEANHAVNGIKVAVEDIAFKDLCRDNYKNTPDYKPSNLYHLNLASSAEVTGDEEWKNWFWWNNTTNKKKE